MEKEKDILKQIEDYAKSSSAFLSTRTEYAKGYRDGIVRAKEIILEILNQTNNAEYGLKHENVSSTR